MKPFLKSYLFIISLFITSAVTAQLRDSCVDYQNLTNYVGPWDELWNFRNMKQKRVVIPSPPHGGIGNDYFFFGMLEYLPDDYNASNTSLKHPLILFFHGNASRGHARNNINHLCRMFKDINQDDLVTYKSIPGRVERNTELFTQAGKKFIVITPQFEIYSRRYPEDQQYPNVYPSAKQVENVINYVIARYPGKIDESRIYLTGYSNGANMIMEYVGSSVARAKRVAAVVPISLCSELDHFSNTAIGVNAANVAEAKLKTWFIHCTSDNICRKSVPDKWVNDIVANGGITPRYTVLRSANADPLYKCNDSHLHDAWSRAYDPDFRASFLSGGVGANDGINQNVYEWMMAQTNMIVPVVMKSYTARLVSNNYVQLEWVTTDEKNNSHFTIERAGPDQQFTEIITLKGTGDYSGEKKYSFRDENPLSGLSHYRLSQTDFDGRKTYFDIKKIINRNNAQNAVVVSPNPVSSELSAFISLARSQKVIVSLTDLSGKILKTQNGIYGLGSSEIKMQAGELVAGIYLLKVSGEDFSVIQKVVKR